MKIQTLTVHERSAVKNSFSTYVWSKLDSFFCESVYTELDESTFILHTYLRLVPVFWEVSLPSFCLRFKLYQNAWINLRNVQFCSSPLDLKKRFCIFQTFDPTISVQNDASLTPEELAIYNQLLLANNYMYLEKVPPNPQYRRSYDFGRRRKRRFV